jgi:hypothetical protein
METTMLQKMEEIYLAILRGVVILVAGILLVATLIYGATSLKIISMEPTKKTEVPKQSVNAIIKEITKKEQTSPSEQQKDSDNNKKNDPNDVYYERIAAAIVDFVEKNSNSNEKVQKAEVVEISKSRAESLDNQKLTNAFAKNFAESIEKILADPSIVDAAKSSSSLTVVNKALNEFTNDFNAQLFKQNKEFEKKQREYIAKKSEGMQSLYLAGISLATFLLIVFLSVILKIERNLRGLKPESIPINQTTPA